MLHINGRRKGSYINKRFGIPTYKINTASLGVYVEYPIFRSYCGNMLFDLTISYNLKAKGQSMFGPLWNFSFVSEMTMLDTSIQLIKGYGNELLFSLDESSIIQYEGFKELKADYITQDRLFDMNNNVFNLTYHDNMTIGHNEKATVFNYATQGIVKQLVSVQDMNGHLTGYEVKSNNPVTIDVTSPNGSITSYISVDGRPKLNQDKIMEKLIIKH